MKRATEAMCSNTSSVASTERALLSRVRSHSAPSCSIAHAISIFHGNLANDGIANVTALPVVECHPEYAAACAALPNPLVPRPFGTQMFPTSSPLQRSEDSRPQQRVAFPPPLPPRRAVRLEPLPERTHDGAPVSEAVATITQNGEDDDAAAAGRPKAAGRWLLHDAALASVHCDGNEHRNRNSSSNSGSAQISPNAAQQSGGRSQPVASKKYLSEQEDETTSFFRNKYTSAVDAATRKDAEHAGERERSAAQIAQLAMEKRDLSDRLAATEGQLRLIRDSSQMSLSTSTSLEQENRRLKKELCDASEEMERVRNERERFRAVIDRQKLTQRDLQGQVDLYKGNTSVPLVAPMADFEAMKKKMEQLDETNTRLTTDLGKRAKEFAERLKETNRERDEWKEKCAKLEAELKARAQEPSGC